jgi:predicted ATPase
VRELGRTSADRTSCAGSGAASRTAADHVLADPREILQEELGENVLEQLGERQILGLALGLDVAGDLHPLAARDRLRDAWISFVEELASARPVVLVIEDAHWAEPPLLELIERTVREARGSILLLTTPASRAGVERRTRRRSHDRPRAARDGGRGHDARRAPAEARELVVARGEGNPFFVEELTAALIDRGVLERENGGGG